MKMTRTGFLKTLTTGLAATAVLRSSSILAIPAERRLLPSARFRSLIGKAFQVEGEGPLCDLTLTAVRSHSFHAKGVLAQANGKVPLTDQFTLSFTALGGGSLVEGTYTLVQESVEPMVMFLTPAGEGAPGTLIYRADFNQVL